MLKTTKSCLQDHTQQSNPIPPHEQVLSTRNISVGTGNGVVGDAINQLATQYTKFPNTAKEQVAVKRGFNSTAGLPYTIGAIDCTHVR